jgi:hypothetical protein
VGIFWKIFDLDFHAAIQYVVNNMRGIDERAQGVVVSKIAADWIQFDIVHESQERNIEGCRSIPSIFFDACMNGIANGFIQHGEPNNMHVKGFAFCNADYLKEEEKEICFGHFLGMLRFHYEAPRLAEACELVPERFRGTCTAQ